MDPIAEMFSQIRNAQNVGKDSLVVPYSKVKIAILKVLKARKQVADFRLIEKDVKSRKKFTGRQIQINLSQEYSGVIHRVSRPGRRVYTSFSKIPRPQKPAALVIVSTSEGILEGEEARKKGLGGEILAEIR